MSTDRRDPHMDDFRRDEAPRGVDGDVGGSGDAGSGGGFGGGGFGGGPGDDGDLRDAFLARAMSQAPDRTALPDWHVRKAVLDHAHEAVSAVEELLTASRAPTRWWNLRTWWRAGRNEEGGGSSRMPWTAALATVVIGVLVTLVWQREPVPGARPDAELPLPPIERQDMEQLPREQMDEPSAQLEPAPERTVPPRTATQAAPRPAPPPTVPQVAQPQSEALKKVEPGLPAADPSAKASSNEELAQESAQPLSPSQMQDLARSQSRVAVPSMPMPTADQDAAFSGSAPAARPAAPGLAGPDASASIGSASGRAETAATGTATATAKDASAAAAAAATASGAAGAARERRASTDPAPSVPAAAALALPPAVSPSPAAAPPLPAAPAAPAVPEADSKAPPPNYVSLARWTELHIASVSGQLRTVPRVEGSSLVALLGDAAAQESSGDVLRELPQWRVSLERKGQPLALLEIGRSQLRWTEGAGAPVTSRPPPALIEALHASLREALRAPAGRARK